MERLLPLALAVLAVFALATVASSLETVSTEPSIESDTTPTGVKTYGPGGGGTGTGGNESSEQSRSTEAAASSGDGPGTQVPLWQVAVGLALFLVGSAAVLYGLTRGEDDDADEGSPAPQPTAPAADRVTLGASVPATNDVYRTWTALCRAVPLDPAGQTPAEVAEAAVAAGYEADAVAELTDTFCAIRYGSAAPTDERERRAGALARQLSLPLEGEP